MLNWMKRRGPIAYLPRDPEPEPQPVVSGKYLLLYKYLHNRYADTVVLTFGQIESLIGFALPDQARLNQQWWTNAAATAGGTNYADSWILARRIATPNLLAQTVVFARAS
ncbi:MAG TPA: hypothetical protein VN797_04645 [Gemmatimonadaceae bacterium]|nr:hypothetical protein [Gemmatimonadaceae bacterium]